ncbi:hypothetical protein [Sphingomonas sp.]|uniref:hypothetical protein n=1 Tax=Sphingomonas sp. TaxID=28214 RepID=UPI002DD65620|nr:hypothetical protein [Sphingomonas sp.]
MTNNVKERQKPTPSVTLFWEGDLGAWFLVTVEANRVAHRVGGVASMPDLDSRQTLFAILLQMPPIALKNNDLRHRNSPWATHLW